ncbi:MAG: hypothetical protein JWQ83_2129 [Lacunisphaera sp.]|nr:hypothetical protein [Lacunisphaera sp.]MDB6166989.1 hypothetical protein [Lacunisphaera sp.]
MDRPENSRWETRFLAGIFILALAWHFYAVTFHWTVGFMSGHEFRQAQTALISYYIDQQDNFSLLYETPVLGKPWVSILLEVPIYEWSVVGLSRMTGWPHVIAARTVSTACFYLMLPAVYLLLGRLRVPRPRRLLVLALVLCAPVYIYYSRAFLMDSMALLCCVWFLLGFVRTMDERRWRWLALATLAGTLAALIKSATFAVWLLPAAGYGAWQLWRDLRARTGWHEPLKTLLWGLATVAVSLGALRAWVAYTDPLKQAHASAWIFTSKNLSQGNWGLFDLRPLFSAGLWHRLLHCWEQAIMSRWLIALGLAAGVAFGAVRWRVLATVGLFFLAQFLFPFAYADQDYYFYSCAVFLHVALGFTLLAVLDSRAPRWCVWFVCLIPLAGEVVAYRQDYWQGQSANRQGGWPLTDALRELTPRNTVLVVAGADWAAMTPLYAQRKALMIRNGLEFDYDYLRRAYNDLADEEVAALVVYGPVREDRRFIIMSTGHFDMDSSAPTFSYPNADVYVSRLHAKAVRTALQDGHYAGITLPAVQAGDLAPKGPQGISPAIARTTFPNIDPGLSQFDFALGVGWQDLGEQGPRVLLAHPSSDLWLTPPADAVQIAWGFGIFPGAYEHAEARTDGVEFIVTAESSGGAVRRIYRRLLDPWSNAADRGPQHAVISYHPHPGETLRFSTRRYEASAYDWAYIVEITVK